LSSQILTTERTRREDLRDAWTDRHIETFNRVDERVWSADFTNPDERETITDRVSVRVAPAGTTTVTCPVDTPTVAVVSGVLDPAVPACLDPARRILGAH
jgi:hypothetical protein